jgi:repressor of nif and glnA expression
MPISKSKAYIASNPRFALTRPARPQIQEGQMTIVYMCLEPSGSVHSLEELVRDCTRRGYKSTFKSADEDIRKSILYHLNLLDEKGLVREIRDVPSGGN